MMRRVSDQDSAMQIMTYLGLNTRLAEGYKLQYEKMYRSLIADSKQNTKLKIIVFSLILVILLIAWWIFVSLDVEGLFVRGIEYLIRIMKLYTYS
jgi:hypothetical protein